MQEPIEPGGNTFQTGIRLGPTMAARVDQLAERRRVTRAALIRQAIDEHLAAAEATPEEAAASA